MKALIRTCVVALALAGLGGIAAPAAAQASIDIRIGTPGYHYRPYYRQGHRVHRHWHRHGYYRQHARMHPRYRGVVVVRRPHYSGYLRWY
jgi:hypothetical protein